MRPPMKTKVGNRGKYAESKVREYLISLESGKSAHFRFPDARAGSLTPAPSDFFLLNNYQPYLIEVKEVDHLYRLPHKNVEPDQVARMRNFKWAGAVSIVVIYFTPSKLWRVKDVDYFLNREGASWDMRDIPTMTLDEVFKGILR